MDKDTVIFLIIAATLTFFGVLLLVFHKIEDKYHLSGTVFAGSLILGTFWGVLIAVGVTANSAERITECRLKAVTVVDSKNHTAEEFRNILATVCK